MSQSEITLVQKPIIKHALIELGLSIKQRIDELDILSMEANEETIQTIKKLRANLNSEKKQVDENFKNALSPVTDIVSELKDIKRNNVDNVYSEADCVLKDKIGDFENTVKAEKKENIVRYFNELCTSSNIDFLKFDNAGLEINLSDSEKKFKEKCDQFVNRVSDDIILIGTMQYPAEMMAEYKKNGLNASSAIKVVTDRKEAEKLEADQLHQAEIQRREGLLRGLAMVYHDITHTFNCVHDESVMISQSEIEKLPKEEFQRRYVEIEAKIKSQKDLFSKQAPKTEQSSPAPEQKPQPAPALSAPVEEKKEEIFPAAFECWGTFSQLKALGQYMKDNNITYKNI